MGDLTFKKPRSLEFLKEDERRLKRRAEEEEEKRKRKDLNSHSHRLAEGTVLKPFLLPYGQIYLGLTF